MAITGNDLRAQRDAASLTQQAVADALHVSRQTLVTWEQRAEVPEPKAIAYLRVIRELASRQQEPSQ